MIKVKVNVNLEKEFNEISKKRKAEKLLSIIAALKAETPVDTGNARDNWFLEKNVIVNNVEYIQQLNEGTSQQAPAYFIEKTLLAQKGVRPSGTIVRFNK